jgi:hypothetical protein
MTRVCMFCDMVFGEKEPLYDRTPTHGICDLCFKEFRVKYENQETVKQEAQNRPTVQTKMAHRGMTPSAR